MKLFSSKRRIVAAAALIVLVLFLLRPGGYLRLLPRPGFDLENLVVFDDPAFGAEPMLRAGEVTAELRLTSLLRGRLEIAHLEMTEPSLNLVHAVGGRWNLAALLERAAHNPLAPTAKAKSEPRPGFPYIEATSARINFKSGAEKKPYALINADFSLWQDSENSWGVRLKAQPFRTDLDLNDTGLLQVSGTWQRANALRDTPLQFIVEWNRAQLGQFTKFFTGNDQGWRGEVLLDVTMTGTPAKLKIASSGSIQDFRRYDITNGRALRLAGHCDGEYSSLDQAFHGLLCSAPVGSGLITLNGDVGLPGSHSYGLTLTAENVPASAAAVLVERAKKNLPDDLVADGTVRGNLRIEQSAIPGSKLQFEGRGEIADFHLASAANKAEIGPETVPFLLTAGDLSTRAASRKAIDRNASQARFPDGPEIEFGPFPVAIGRTAAPTVRGWVNAGGYNLAVVGEAEITKALRVARMFGLPALQSAAEGTAQIDLQISGSWAGRSQGTASGFGRPQVTGTAKLRNVRVGLRGVAAPVEIVSADVQLLPDEVRVAKLNAKTAETAWTGSLQMPRGCGTPGACSIRFVLNANQIALGELSEWVSPSPKERPWYRVLESSGQAGPSFFASLRASGQVTAERLQLQKLGAQSLGAQSFGATRVSAKVILDGGKLDISELNADFLGGSHRGRWQADFSVKPAVCTGSGSLKEISLARLADATKDEGIAGIANTSYEVTGTCATEFWKSAEGTLQFVMKDGTLPHVALGDDAEPLKITRFAGLAKLHAGTVEVKDSGLESAGGKFQVSGNATLQGELDFRLTRNPGGAAPGFAISGTLAEPRVAQVAGAETQARLKP
ncbi:MAG: AsmA-like C-terminal region-containing protein [Candidatus Sulfotelmatobacter sp.]